MDDFLMVMLIFVVVGWLAGAAQILASDNIPLVKILLLGLAMAFPPFAYVYLIRRALINDIKKAPQRIKHTAETATKVAKTTGKVAAKTAEWLVKK